MRHHVAHHRLHRGTAHREALMKNLATALFDHERIETTLPKARALRPYAERLITLAKRGDLHARRLAARHIHDHGILHKLFAELSERFKTRHGGYTRIMKLGFRRGDNADMSLIELVDAKLRPATPAKADLGKGAKAEAKPKAAKKTEAVEHEEKAAKATEDKPAKAHKAAAAKKPAKEPKAPKPAKKAKDADDKPAKKPAAKKETKGSKKASKPAK
ncbi:MAG: 50S ribosomal protein L17 [Deltaproteobacteria bacterium]|nr:50S ribosomal protein L17 [Deltaproteobacteria bacterium]